MRELTKAIAVVLVILSLGFGATRLIQHLYIPSAPECGECHCVVPGGWCCCEGKCKPKCTCVHCSCIPE